MIPGIQQHNAATIITVPRPKPAKAALERLHPPNGGDRVNLCVLGLAAVQDSSK